MHSVVDQNLRAAMRCYANLGNGSEARDYPGVTVASSGLDAAVFNSAMLTEYTANLEGLIDVVDVHFRSRGLRWTFWICDDLLAPELRDWRMRNIFRSKGMTRIAEAPGMYAESLLPHTRRPAPMTFARVTTERARLEFAHIASVVFSLPFGTSKRIYGAPGLWQAPTQGWVGYFEGKPVSIVTIVVAGDAIGVYSWELCRSIRGVASRRRYYATLPVKRGAKLESTDTVFAGHDARVQPIPSNGLSSGYQIQDLHSGRLRLFLTICHTRRIMRFWLLCLFAVLACAPTGAEPASATDQKFTWQFGVEWRLIRADWRA